MRRSRILTQCGGPGCSGWFDGGREENRHVSAPFLGMNGREEELVHAMILVHHAFWVRLQAAHNPIAALLRFRERVQAACDDW